MAYQLCWALVCGVFISMLRLVCTHNAPEDYVNAHNEVRKEIGLPAMTWDPTVAHFAETYANHRKADCALVHSHNPKYGENIAIGWGEFSGLDAIKLWVDEKAFYHYESNSCTRLKMCGHYTQVVWKNSTRLGCARAKCLNHANFVTCNYEPPGNYIGDKPY